ETARQADRATARIPGTAAVAKPDLLVLDLDELAYAVMRDADPTHLVAAEAGRPAELAVPRPLREAVLDGVDLPSVIRAEVVPEPRHVDRPEAGLVPLEVAVLPLVFHLEEEVDGVEVVGGPLHAAAVAGARVALLKARD